MYSTLQIPAFPLSVLLYDDPEAAASPAALVSTTKDVTSSRHAPTLLAVNSHASRFRLTPGLTTTRALARCPQLILLPPDPALEHQQQKALRTFTSSLGPDFEETAPGTFLLDLLTLPHAQRNPLDWIEQTLRKATALRLPLHLALAPTPDLALLAVHSPSLISSLTFTPDPAFLFRDTIAQRDTIADLPLSCLQHLTFTTSSSDQPLDPALLSLWGLKTLGDLAQLPRQGLAERLGPAIARLHDILHGKHHRLLTLYRPPQHFQLAQELEYALETLEPLLFLLRRGLDTLCARLASSQRAAISMQLSLTFDDGNLHQLDLRLPEPTSDPPTLLRLLHTHLDTIRAPAPVVAWSLKLLPTLPGEAQHHLFERSLRDPHKFADTLARIEALLGPGRLGRPEPVATHKPDTFHLHPPLSFKTASPETPATLSPPPLPSSTTALPLKRLRPPIDVHVASELRGRYLHPLALLTGPHRGPISALHGPFSLSGSWWSPEERWHRVEWDLQLSNKTLLRLIFAPPHTWSLEGVYE